MTISASDVQQLRKATGAGMMDAKRALEEADGDADRAAEILREKGIADARKRSDRTQGEGSIGSYMHRQADRPVIGVMVWLACETDFVAKSEDFQQAANAIAMHIAHGNPSYVSREDVPEEAVAKERELIAAAARNEGKPEDVIDKIVDGRIRQFFEDLVLYDQQFVNPDRFDGTVGEMVEQLTASLGENIGVRRFSRIAVGDGGEV